MKLELLPSQTKQAIIKVKGPEKNIERTRQQRQSLRGRSFEH